MSEKFNNNFSAPNEKLEEAGFVQAEATEVLPEAQEDNVVSMAEHRVADPFGNVIGMAGSAEDAVRKFRQNEIDKREAA